MAFNDKLAKILSSLDSAIDRAVEDATASLRADATFRIFDKGQDANTSQIGQYSESYKKTRKKKGLQTSYVDLTNTTNLKNTISINSNQVFFKNEYGVKVSGYNERTFKKRIFAPTDAEAKKVITFINEELNNLWKS